MTPQEANRIIKEGKPVTVYNSTYDETFTALFIGRDRFGIFTDTGGVFDRGELIIVKEDKQPT